VSGFTAIRRSGSRATIRRLTVLAAATALAAGAAAASGASGATPHGGATGLTARTASGGTTYVTALVAAAGRIRSLPAGLAPALQNAANDSGAVMLDAKPGCNPATTTTTVPSCIYGDTHSSKTIVLIGDSHAQMWVPALNQIGSRLGYKLVVITKASCPAADLDIYDYTRNKPYVECSKFHQFAIARAKQLKPNILILASLARGISLANGVGKGISPATWQAGVFKTLSAIPAQKKIVIGDIPFLGPDGGPDCLAANGSNVQACSLSEKTATSQLQTAAEEKAAAQAHATFIDTTPWFCAQSKCYAVIGKYDIYSDDAHIDATYSDFLSNALQTFL
jgi:hypothetical protein